MKRTFYFLLLFCLTAAVASAQGSSKKFTGTITYKITYPSSATGPMVASLPTTLEMQISGNKARTSMMLPFGNNTFIINGDEQSVTRLVDMESGKYFTKKTREDFSMPAAPMVVPLKETKVVAGQNCKAAEIRANTAGKTTTAKVYYSEELGTNMIYFNTMVRSLSGIMLEFEYNIMGMPVQLTAISINPGRVSNKVFEIPSGYTETTEAKLREMKGPAKK
jgi:DNA-directed RNA polymerase beta subunit